jgi:hypothetical protein
MTEEAKYAAAEASLAAEQAQTCLGGIIEGRRVYSQTSARLTEAAGNVAIAGAQIGTLTEAAESVTYPTIGLARMVLAGLESLPNNEVQDIIHLVKAVKAAAVTVMNSGIEPATRQRDEAATMGTEINEVVGQATAAPDITDGSYADIRIGQGLLDEFIANA